jgi:hypothetical protein
MKNPIPLKYRLFKKYNGAPKQPHDWRDIVLGDIPFTPDPNCPSWDIGFDNEAKYGMLKREHQGSSLSCVGQGWSKYLEMINLIEEKHIDDLSARDIYSQIYLQEGGAYIRDGAQTAVDKGCSEEKLCHSYIAGNPPDEPFMRNRCNSYDCLENAAQYKSKRYVYLPTASPLNDDDWENIRQVVWQFGGFTSGYNRHCMYVSAYKKINGKRAIKFVNSYGVGSDIWYIEGSAKYPIYDITFLVDLPNPPAKINMLRLIADIKTQSDPQAKQYVLGKDGFYRWIYNPTLLAELNDSGVIDATKLEWIDNFDYTKVKETWAVIK